jgi:hypothetical protein
VAGLVRWKAVGQILPAGAAAQNPEDAVEHLTRIPPGAAAPVGPARRFGKQRFDESPLFIRELFSSCHTSDRNTAPVFMRPLLVNRLAMCYPPLRLPPQSFGRRFPGCFAMWQGEIPGPDLLRGGQTAHAVGRQPGCGRPDANHREKHDDSRRPPEPMRAHYGRSRQSPPADFDICLVHIPAFAQGTVAPPAQGRAEQRSQSFISRSRTASCVNIMPR